MTYVLLGLSLGLSAGIAPGPLLALLLQRSLQHGKASGIRVALAPLLTDIPIVALAIFMVGRLPATWITILLGFGGLFVLWLAFDAWRQATRQFESTPPPSAGQDLLHGALVNFLNPHPYLFWLTVGAPTVIHAWRQMPVWALAFIISFYVLLIGSKVVLAVLVGRAGSLSRQRQWLRFSAVLLVAAGIWMLVSAVQSLGGIA